MDRRIPHTRSRLERALISLVLKNGYDAVSISDICQEAGVGRSTFYLHFSGKEDLKRSGLSHLRRRLADLQAEAAQAGPDTPVLAFTSGLFEHARDHLDLYRALVGSRGGIVALSEIRDILCDLVRAEMPPPASSSAYEPASRELAVQYVTGALISVLTWWLDAGARIPPERLDAMVRRLAVDGIPMVRNETAGPTPP